MVTLSPFSTPISFRPFAALETLNQMDKTRSWKKISELGMYFRKRLKDLAEKNGIKIEIKGFTEESNVNGILHSLLKDLPKEGDKIKTNGLSFVVEELSENVASKIRITKNKK